MQNRTLIVLALVAIVAVAALGVVYVYGTPQSATVATTSGSASGEVATGEVAQAAAPQQPVGEKSAVGTVAPEPDPNTPLAIEIPGCVCHSDDPKLVKSHSEYRMNQCAGCHAGGVPTGQE